jgi:hypothetical protein
MPTIGRRDKCPVSNGISSASLVVSEVRTSGPLRRHRVHCASHGGPRLENAARDRALLDGLSALLDPNRSAQVARASDRRERFRPQHLLVLCDRYRVLAPAARLYKAGSLTP